ncbi:MAG TPA: cytochrome P450 [Gaiellaceae bacterium]|nr:cytochrome P450 [Gaiellaceae bacterium]
MPAPEARISVRELRRDPDDALRRVAERGDLVWVRAGRGRFLLTRSPDAVRETLVERAEELAKPRSQRIAVGRPGPEPPPGRISPPKLRRALARGMSSGAGRTAEAVSGAAVPAAQRWHDGERIRLMPWLRPLVIDAVVRGAFASPLGDDDRQRLEVVVRWADRSPRVTGRRPTLHALARPLAFARLSLVVRSLLAHADLSRYSELSAVALEHEDFAPGSTERERQALLGELLLGAVGPLVQTSGWALFRFGAEPAAAARLRSEWYGGTSRAYTEAFVREVTRLHPTNPHITRVALVDTSVGGEPVPAHTRVVVDVAALHRDPRLYDEPDRFSPERWLEGRSPEQKFASAAFGIGDRRCLGEAIAMKALAALVEAVGRHCDLAFDEVDVTARGRRQLADDVAVTVTRRPAS